MVTSKERNKSRTMFSNQNKAIIKKIENITYDIDRRYKLFNFGLFNKVANLVNNKMTKQGISNVITIDDEETTIDKLITDVKACRNILNNMRKKRYYVAILNTHVNNYKKSINSPDFEELLKTSYEKCIEMLDEEFSKAKEMISKCINGYKEINKIANKYIKQTKKESLVRSEGTIKITKEGRQMFNIDEYLNDSVDSVMESVLLNTNEKTSATFDSKLMLKDAESKYKECIRKAAKDLIDDNYDNAVRSIDECIKELNTALKTVSSLKTDIKDVSYELAVTWLTPVLRAIAFTGGLNKILGKDSNLKSYGKGAAILVGYTAAQKALVNIKRAKASNTGISPSDFFTCLGDVKSAITLAIKDLEGMKAKVVKAEIKYKEKMKKREKRKEIVKTIMKKDVNESAIIDSFDLIVEITEAYAEGDITEEEMDEMLESMDDELDVVEDEIKDDPDIEEGCSGKGCMSECGDEEECSEDDRLKKALADGVITQDQYDILTGCKNGDDNTTVPEQDDADVDEVVENDDDETDIEDKEEIEITPSPMTADEYNKQCDELYKKCNNGEITLDEREAELMELKEKYEYVNALIFKTEEDAIKSLKRKGFETDLTGIHKRLSNNRFAKRGANGKVIQTAIINKKGDGYQITMM